MKRVYELDVYKLAEALEKNMKAKFPISNFNKKTSVMISVNLWLNNYK